MTGIKIVLQPALQNIHEKLNEIYVILQRNQDAWDEYVMDLDFNFLFFEAFCLDVDGLF